MMAFDSSHPPPSRLNDETLALVRDELRAFLIDGHDPEPLRAALVAMARDAHEKAMLPEHLLIALKEVWGGLAEVRTMSNVGEQIRVQQRVVTMCIQEYFGA